LDFQQLVRQNILLLACCLSWSNASAAPAPRVSSQEASDATMQEVARLEKLKDLDGGIEILLRHLIKNGSDPVAASKMSDLLIQKGDFLRAFRIAGVIKRYYPDYDWPYILQFKSALELKKFSSAQKILKKFDEVPTSANRDQLRGDYYRLKGELLRADDFYEKALNGSKKTRDLFKLRVWNLRNAAAEAIESKDLNKAEAAVGRLLKITKGRQKIESLELSADIKIRQGKLDLAEQDLSEIISKVQIPQIKEKLADVRTTLANQAYNSGNIELTETWLDAADQLGPNYNALILRANIRRDEGHYDKASELYDGAKALNNKDPNLFEAMAWNYTLWTRYQDAESAIMSAIELEPNDPRYHVIKANQLKNGRKLSMALGELIKGRQLCEADKDCKRFSDIYDERFFEYTDAEGLSLDFLGLPITMTASIGYREDSSDLVGVTRGLASQNVATDDYALFLSPSKSPVLDSRLQFGFYKAEKPFISGYFERTNKIGPKREVDPTVSMMNQIAAIETEGSFPLPYLGVVSIFPYFKYTAGDSHAFDTSVISGRMVRSKEYLIGSRGLWQFRWYLPALEGEIGYGKLVENSESNLSTLRTRLGLQQSFAKYFRFQLDGSLYKKNLSSNVIQSQFQGTTRISVLPIPSIRITGGYELLKTDDLKISTDIPTKARVSIYRRQTTGGLAFTKGESFRLESTFSRVILEPYRVYDHTLLNHELELTARPRLSREIGLRSRLPYLAPIRLIIGQNIQTFYPPKNQEDASKVFTKARLSSYYLSTKLFW